MTRDRFRARLARIIDWSGSELLSLAAGFVLVVLGLAFVITEQYRYAAIISVVILFAALFLIVFGLRRVRIASKIQMSGLGLAHAGAGGGEDAVESGARIDPARLGCHADYLRIARARDAGGSLDATLIRTGSTQGRDLMAYLMSGLRWNFQQVRSLCEGYRDDIRRRSFVEIVRKLKTGWTLRLARVLALQNELPDDRRNALALMRMIYETRSMTVFAHPYAKIYFELALDDGDHVLARNLAATLPIRPTDRTFIEADLANPAIDIGADQQHWLLHFNTSFLNAGLEPVVLSESAGGLPAMDRLACPYTGPVQGAGSRVTVIVTTWCPGSGLLTAVNSILRQSWPELEIIVVDDASPQEYSSVLDECALLDDRIIIVRQQINGGTYVARNAALELATGEFITFQDDDDWSHPRRIERQLQPLLADDAVMMTTSHALRCNEQMVFSHVGYSAIRKNASSLLFRRSQVMDRVGYMDSVRKAADSEYALRIVASFGKESYVALMEPLAIIRMRSDSLSRSDFKPGWHHPARVAYRDAYQHWHAGLFSGTSSAYRRNEIEPRPFPAPLRFLVDADGPQAQHRAHYDFVLAGDWRKNGGPQKSMIEEIAALTRAGHKVGILHLEAFRFMEANDRKLCEPIRILIARGVVDEIVLTDSTRIDVLILRYPPILQFLPALKSSLSIGLFLVVANQAPHENDGSDFRYEVGPCIDNATAFFGITPIWMPQGDPVRKQLKPLLPPALLHAENMPGIIEVPPDACRWRGPAADIPVIGRYSRDTALKFPKSKKELLEAYPAAPDIEVRIMGGRITCKRLIRKRSEIPANWTILEYDEIPVEDFLRQIDFFVHFDHSSIVEAFGRSLLEAMAAGCVVITDPKFRPVFGDGLVYCKPHQVESIVRALYADWDSYLEQRKKGVELASSMFSYEAYITRMEQFQSLVAGT